jgi:hypothetical protein
LNACTQLPDLHKNALPDILGIENRRPKMGLFSWLFGNRDPYYQEIERNRRRAAENMGFTYMPPPLGDGGSYVGSCDVGSSTASCDAGAGGGGDGGGGGC